LTRTNRRKTTLSGTYSVMDGDKTEDSASYFYRLN